MNVGAQCRHVLRYARRKTQDATRNTQYVVFRIVISLLTLFALGLRTTPAHASVTLVSFTATPAGDHILLRWETATEIDNAGFFIRRSLQVDGEYPRISPFIPAQGDSLIGAVYTYVDQDVDAGNTYYYKLEAVDNDQSTELHGPIFATVGPVATATPTVTPTPLPTATPTATPRPTRTATPTVTSTPRPSSTPTATSAPAASPTPTRTSTITRTPTRTRTSTVMPGPGATATHRPTATPWPARTRRPTSTPRPTRTRRATPTGTATSSAMPAGTRTPVPTQPLAPAAGLLLSVTLAASPFPVTADVVPMTKPDEPAVGPASTGAPAVGGLESEAAPRRLSSSPTRPAPAVSEAPSSSSGPAQVEAGAPGSPRGRVTRRGLLAGGIVALVALVIAGWLYTFLHRLSRQ